jgi:hypothetical protein
MKNNLSPLLMKNKRGLGTGGTILVILLAIVVIGMVVVGTIYVTKGETIPQSITTDENGTIIPPSSSDNGCQIAPTINPSVNDELNPSTSVTAIMSAKINNGGNKTITSSTTFAKGDKVELFLASSGYEKQFNTLYISECKAYSPVYSMKAISSPSVTILTSPSNTAVTNVSTAVATTNLTKVSAGGALSFNIRMVGTDKKTTGNMVVLIEGNKSISSITLNGVTGAVKSPSKYSTRVGTNSQVFYFEIPAFDNAQDKIFNAVATMKSGESYAVVPLYVSVIGKDNFLDSSGSYNYGIETTDGQTKTSAYETLAVAWIE